MTLTKTIVKDADAWREAEGVGEEEAVHCGERETWGEGERSEREREREREKKEIALFKQTITSSIAQCKHFSTSAAVFTIRHIT